MRWNDKRRTLRRSWPWLLGVVLGLGGAALHFGVRNAEARGDDAVVYKIDLSSPLTQAEVEELARFALEHEGSDVILEPVGSFQVPAGEERRSRDEARARREAAELAQAETAGLAGGLLVTGAQERAECAFQNQLSTGAPGRHLLCEGSLTVAPPRLAFERAAGRRSVETLLETYLRDLLDGVSSDEAAAGFGSSFSDATALDSLTLGDGGLVEVNFNGGIEAQVEPLHTGYATHTMLQQIYRTLFQFRDVEAVTIRLDGSCEAFGELIGGPCQKLDRGLWETMNSENGERVDFFTLGGGL